MKYPNGMPKLPETIEPYFAQVLHEYLPKWYNAADQNNLHDLKTLDTELRCQLRCIIPLQYHPDFEEWNAKWVEYVFNHYNGKMDWPTKRQALTDLLAQLPAIDPPIADTPDYPITNTPTETDTPQPATEGITP
jgi:hypothetical protein